MRTGFYLAVLKEGAVEARNEIKWLSRDESAVTVADITRLVRRRRQSFDYRPGLPLQAFWSVFVRTPAPDNQQAVGQVEQMMSSRCWSATSGALGCISCHDPHALPEPDKRVAFYRTRCLACHQDRGCSLPAESRQAQDNSCIACHMPRIGPADVAHTSLTDHRIGRRGDRSRPSPSRRPNGQPDQARREITILLASDTPHKEALRRLLLQLP